MEEEVYLHLTEKVRKPTKHKLAIFFCGAAGTGKTSTRYKFLNDAKIKTSFVYLNLDNIKETGREEARRILNHSTNRAIEDGYSIFYDGTCRNKGDISEVMKYLKTKNYKIVLGMTYTTLPTALKRLEERRNQFVPESVAKDIYKHMSKNAEDYMDMKDIDEIYLYNNEITATLIYKKTSKSVDCILPTEKFYFDVSEYC